VKAFRKVVISLLLISLMLYLTGCSVSDYQKSIYDDDSKIASQADSYNFRSRSGNTSNEKTEVKFGAFYGADTLWTINANKDSVLTVEYDVKLEKGDFKVVLIDPDNKIIAIVSGQKAGEQEVKVKSGNSRIKIVGKNAKGQVKINITGNKDLKIKRINN
jgi:hypothetical protein